MLYQSSTLIAVVAALPVIFAQAPNPTAPRNGTSASAPSASGSASASSSSNTTSQPSDATAVSSSTFAPTNFTPVIATGTSCGTAQQNFNQCVNKVAKDISNCGDNVCLCQTYANIAACYNGCPELAPQGQQYTGQSQQYCTLAGVKPNTTVATTPNVPVTTTPTSSNTTPLSNNATNSTSANTFSAAKGSNAVSVPVPSAGALALLLGPFIAFCL